MADSTAIYQRFTKEVIIVGVAQLILSLRGLILLPIIAKLLGAAAYGVWAQAHITLSLLGTFASLGTGFAFLRFFAAETGKDKIREGFFSMLMVEFGWSCLIAIIFFFAAAPLARSFFGGIESINIVQLCAIILPFYASHFQFLFFFRALREMKSFVSLLLALSFGELALIVILILSGRGIYGAIFAMLITYVLIDLVMFSLVVKRVGLSLPRLSSLAKIKDYLRFGLPLLPSSIAGWLVQSSGRYVIAVFLGIAPTGIYSAAYSLGSTVSVYMGPLGMVLVPALSYLYDNHQIEDVKKHLTYTLKYFLLLAIPSAAGLSLLAKPLLRVIATSEFATAGAIVVPFVATAMLLLGCQGIINQSINLVKRTVIIGIVVCAVAGLNLGLNILLVPLMGIVAAAITTLISFAIAIGWTSYISFKYLKFDIDWMFILKSLLATAAMSGVVLLFNPISVPRLLFVIGAGAVVYFCVIFLLRGISRQEIVFFRRLLVSLNPSVEAK